MSNESVDLASEMGYNVGKDETMIVVKMAEQSAIHDTTCKHDVLVPDPEDTIGDATYHGCANTSCNVGFYLRK